MYLQDIRNFFRPGAAQKKTEDTFPAKNLDKSKDDSLTKIKNSKDKQKGNTHKAKVVIEESDVNGNRKSEDTKKKSDKSKDKSDSRGKERNESTHKEKHKETKRKKERFESEEVIEIDDDSLPEKPVKEGRKKGKAKKSLDESLSDKDEIVGDVVSVKSRGKKRKKQVCTVD